MPLSPGLNKPRAGKIAPDLYFCEPQVRFFNAIRKPDILKPAGQYPDIFMAASKKCRNCTVISARVYKFEETNLRTVHTFNP